jgi:cysteine desulfurase
MTPQLNANPRTYLDYNATAPLRHEARAAMLVAMDAVGNPSSVHAEGRHARALVETAREQIAALVGAKPLEVVFTSGATEANAWVINAGGWDTIFACDVEHESVRTPLKESRARIVNVPVDANGVARVEAIASGVLCGPQVGRALVLLQVANNETGVIQPVTGVAHFAREHGLIMHTDAVQAAGRLPLDMAALGVDTLSLSAHKLGGPKGIGALIIRDGTKLANLISGGGQERRRRGGTENVVGIAGFGAAAQAAAAELAQVDRIRALRDKIEWETQAVAPLAHVIGDQVPRLPNTSCIVRRGQSAETLVIKFDLCGIALSSGSACSSGKVGPSHVLAAQGLDPIIARSAIRISLGWNTTDADVDAFNAAWCNFEHELTHGPNKYRSAAAVPHVLGDTYGRR